jgi:hypothetical protein
VLPFLFPFSVHRSAAPGRGFPIKIIARFPDWDRGEDASCPIDADPHSPITIGRRFRVTAIPSVTLHDAPNDIGTLMIFFTRRKLKAIAF